MMFNTRRCGVCMSRNVQDPMRCTNIYHFPPLGFRALHFPPHWGNWQRPLKAQAPTIGPLDLKTTEVEEMNALIKEIYESLPEDKEALVHEELLELLMGNPEFEACFANWKPHTNQDSALPDMAKHIVPKTSTPVLFGKWSAFFPCDWKLGPRLLRGQPSSLE